MKFIKALFSRFTIISLSIIMQIAIFLVLLWYVEEYYVYVKVASSILSYLALLALIKKRGNPNHKIPWMIIVLGFPPFGLLIYVMFGNGYLSKKHRRLYQSTKDRSEPFLIENEVVTEEVKTKFPKYYHQSRYIKNVSLMPLYQNTEVKYLKSGEEYFEKLLIDLRNAKKFIFLEYFIISLGEIFTEILKILVEKVHDGLEVKIIYDDIGSIKTLPYRYDAYLRSLGIQCVKFNRYLPIASAVHNNRDHRKIAIIDGDIGYTGGVNLADEYANIVSRFGKWKDSGVRLYGEAVKSLTIMFLTTFEVYSQKTENYLQYMPEDKIYCSSEQYVQPFADAPAPIHNQQIAHNIYLNMINQANQYIYITTPYLIIDYMLTNALINAALRGIEVIIVTPAIPDKKIIFTMTRASYGQLIEAGVKIYEYTPGFIHAKNIVVDDEIAIVGTINLDYRSLVHHFECGCYFISQVVAQFIKEDFLEILSVSKQPPKKVYRKKNVLWRLYISILEFFAPLA